MYCYSKITDLFCIVDEFCKEYDQIADKAVNNLNNYGDNYGIQSLDSDFNKPKINQDLAAPIYNPPKKSLFKRIYSDPLDYWYRTYYN